MGGKDNPLRREIAPIVAPVTPDWPAIEDWGPNDATRAASLDLTARLMAHNAEETASITAAVMRNKQHEIDRLTLTLGYIRDKITLACDGAHAPNPIVILNLLNPTEDELDRYGSED